MGSLKELRYRVMLALYFPILAYAFSTFDLSEDTYAVQEIQPVVMGEQTVVLGQDFSARAFLAVGGSEGQKLRADGDLQVLGDSLFRMSTSTLLGEDEDEAIVPYAGSFSFQQIGGATTEIPVAGSFRVRRPEIVAASEATQALYRSTLNEIRIEVPGLENKQLRLESGGRTVDGRSIALSPSGDASAIRVFLADSSSQSDVFLGSKQFSVIEPPRPELRVLNAGREISSGDNLPKRRALLEFEVVPDQEFRRRYPRDARYRVGRATVYLRKGMTASQEIGTFDLDGDKLVLTRQLRDAQPGDRVLIRLEGVTRINHAGTPVNVDLSETSRTFGFTVS